jgi:hypothetical protein
VTLTAKVSTNSNGAGPTGTVQFQNGSSNLGSAVACVPTDATAKISASCTATLTTTLSSLPGPFGDSRRWPRYPVFLWLPLACALLLFVYFLSSVRNRRWRRYGYAGVVLLGLAVAGIAGCGGKPNPLRSITGAYSGDVIYAGSTSLPVVVTVQ